MINQTFQNKSDKKYVYLLFLLSPIIALFLSILRNKESWSKNVFLLFLIFYGFNFVIIDKSYDSYYYKTQFDYIRYYYLIEGQFNLSNTSYAYTGFDFLQPILTFLVAIFTDDARYLFAVFAAVFGFFYSRNIWYILSKLNNKLNLAAWTILIVLLLLIPIWFINGVRMWTAAHMFIFGLLPYLFENKRKNLIFCFLSIFMHFSFVFPLGILILFYFFKPPIKPLFILFILSAFLNELDLEAVKSFLMPFLPSFASDRVDLYTSDSYVDKYENSFSKANILVLVVASTFKILTFLLIAVMMYNLLSNAKITSEYRKSIAFIFSFGIVCNLVISIPSMGRFMTVFNFLFYSLFLILLNQGLFSKFEKKIFPLIGAFYFLFIVQSVRASLDSMNVVTLFGNPFVSFFIKAEYPVINFIK